MKTPLIAKGALALAVLSLTLPSLADARTRHHVHRYATRSCSEARQRHGANGAIIGAIGGGIVGNAVSGGNKLPGTLLGAGVGAVAGHAVGKNSRC